MQWVTTSRSDLLGSTLVGVSIRRRFESGRESFTIAVSTVSTTQLHANGRRTSLMVDCGVALHSVRAMVAVRMSGANRVVSCLRIERRYWRMGKK